MPAAKPIDLHADYGHRARYERRRGAEDALAKPGDLPERPPAELRGDKAACATWRKTVKLFNGLQGQVLTTLDLAMLARYCQTSSRVDDLTALRAGARKVLGGLLAEYEQPDKLASEKITLLKNIHTARQDLAKMDSALDRASRLLWDCASALYLLPRARVGVTPAKKEDEEPKDDMEKLLDEDLSISWPEAG